MADTKCVLFACPRHCPDHVSLAKLHLDMQLLGELLLERSNLKVMVRYVADEENLKLMMNLLKDQSRSIQFEAFHVFKVSVHNCVKGPLQHSV